MLTAARSQQQRQQGAAETIQQAENGLAAFVGRLHSCGCNAAHHPSPTSPAVCRVHSWADRAVRALWHAPEQSLPGAQTHCELPLMTVDARPRAAHRS